MQSDDEPFEDLADAVLDGEVVDWAAAESNAAPGARSLVRQLRFVASIARLYDGAPSASLRSAGGTPSSEPPAADCWGHLRLLERIGRGAFGEVFRAWDTRLDREVALKLLPVGAPSDEHAAASIIREGRLLAKVRHPNVVTIHGAEQIGDRIGLSMEFVRGQTVEQLLRQGTVFRPDEIVHIGLQLARAVSAVHAAGLLHRDIKAHNVTRAEDGRVVLMDFGTGRELSDGTASDLTGTPLYLAPEVLGGGQATPQSDVYSLGVLLYHLATGSYPIRGRTLQDVRRAHAYNERVGVRAARPDVPVGLARVIDRSTDPRPERRYPSADALARDLTERQPHRSIGRLTRALGVAGALCLLAFAASEVRARLAGEQRGVRSRLVSLMTGAPSPLGDPVIVVLPFRNLSSEPGSARLVDSLTAGLIQQLGIIDGLKVTFQQSSFMLRGHARDLASLGRQLGVNLAVEGDVHLSGGRLVIHAALLPVAGGTALWTDTLTREVRSAGDLSDVLTEIARTIVDRLRLSLGPTRRRYSTDLVTYETYLRARELRDRRLGRGREAIPLFQDVLRRDPQYAPAIAALAATFGDLTMSWPNPDGYALAPHDAAALMAPLTEKVLAIDSALAEAHAAQAYLHAFARRWADAEASFRRALRLDPTITAMYGDFVLSTLEPWGRVDESIATLKAALARDPLSLDLLNVLARMQLGAGHFEDALANCQRVVEEEPDFPFAEEYCARALAAIGRTTEALALFTKRSGSNEHGIGYIYAITGRRAEAEALAARNAHLPNRQALIYAGLGDKDRAFGALDRLALLNPRRAGAYLNYPELALLRGDPRVTALRRRLGFPQ